MEGRGRFREREREREGLQIAMPDKPCNQHQRNSLYLVTRLSNLAFPPSFPLSLPPPFLTSCPDTLWQKFGGTRSFKMDTLFMQKKRKGGKKRKEKIKGKKKSPTFSEHARFRAIKHRRTIVYPFKANASWNPLKRFFFSSLSLFLSLPSSFPPPFLLPWPVPVLFIGRSMGHGIYTLAETVKRWSYRKNPFDGAP